MKYAVRHTTKYEYPSDVVIGYNFVHLKPRDLKDQSCSSFRLVVSPEPETVNQRLDYFGNPCSLFNIDQPHRRLTVTAISEVEVRRGETPTASATPAWEQVVEEVCVAESPDELEAIQFSCDSPDIVSFDGLKQYALQSFANGRPILEAAVELMGRIFDDFQYDPSATSVNSEIREAFEKRRGVCQDFAHFQIGCLRELGIPARYVSGYIRTLPPEGQEKLVGSDASHAWLSVWCGQETGWIDLDPTNNQIVGNDHITVAVGRDYGDVCPVKGVIVGSASQNLAVSVSVEPID